MPPALNGFPVAFPCRSLGGNHMAHFKPRMIAKEVNVSPTDHSGSAQNPDFKLLHLALNFLIFSLIEALKPGSTRLFPEKLAHEIAHLEKALFAMEPLGSHDCAKRKSVPVPCRVLKLNRVRLRIKGGNVRSRNG